MPTQSDLRTRVEQSYMSTARLCRENRTGDRTHRSQQRQRKQGFCAILPYRDQDGGVSSAASMQFVDGRRERYGGLSDIPLHFGAMSLLNFGNFITCATP